MKVECQRGVTKMKVQLEEHSPERFEDKQAGIQRVPIHEKVTMTIREAAEYSSIGINKLEALLRTPRCTFVLYVGKKKLVKRKEFEKFISENIEI